MKYIATLNIWAPGIQEAICSGQIRIQRGQWLRCGETGKRCRYVGHDGPIINVVHWQGSGRLTRELFERRCDVAKLENIRRNDGVKAWRQAINEMHSTWDAKYKAA